MGESSLSPIKPDPPLSRQHQAPGRKPGVPFAPEECPCGLASYHKLPEGSGIGGRDGESAKPIPWRPAELLLLWSHLISKL
jgi:hypothetical protein